MAYSYVQLPGDGTNKNFNFTFGYLSRAHVSVKVNLVDTPFTWLTDFSVQITPAPAAGSVVEIRRNTPLDQPAVVWNDGATLTEADMNLDTRFNLYANQEAKDAVADAVTKDATGVWDGQGRKTTNFADPTDDTGLVTRHYFESVYTPQLDAKVAVATTKANEASTSAATAQGYAAAADASADSAAALLGLFRGQYLGAQANAPTVDGNGQPVTAGDLYFNTTENAMKVYTGVAWQNAGSVVQGILNKPAAPVIATAGQTVVPVSSGFDPALIIVFVNGTRIDVPDVDVSSGTNIVFATGLNAGDEVSWIAFGAFNVANAIPADGSVTDAKVAANAAINATKLRVTSTVAGAVPRAVSDKLGELTSVKDVGAAGDGTADDGAALNKLTAVGLAPPGTYKTAAKPTGAQQVIAIGAAFSGANPLDGWSPGFGGTFRVMDMTGANALVGSVHNKKPANTLAFPTGVTGYGRSDNAGNQAFGLFGRADLYASGGGVVTNEVNSFNFGGSPSASLPPNRSFGTTDVLPIALTVAAGGNYPSAIGIHLSREGENPQPFLTGMYFSPDSVVNYGVFIDSVAGSTHTPLVVAHAVGKVGIQIRGRGTPVPSGAWLSYTDGNGVDQFAIKQDGHLSFSAGITQTTHGAAGAAVPLPSNPTGYIKVEIGGATKVIPYYEAA